MSIHWPETAAEKTGSNDTLRGEFPAGATNKPGGTGYAVGFWMRLDERLAETSVPQTILARDGGLNGGSDAFLRLNQNATLSWSSRLGGGAIYSGGTPSSLVEETTYLVMQIVTANRVHIVFAEPGQTPVFGTNATTALYSGSPNSSGGVFQYIGSAAGANVRPFAGGELSDIFMLHGDFLEVGTDPDTSIISDIADGTLALSAVPQSGGGTLDLRFHYPLRHRTDFSDAGPQGFADLKLNNFQNYETGVVFTSRGPLRPEALMPNPIADCIAPLTFETPGDISTAKVSAFRVEGGTYTGAPSAIEARLIKEDGTDHVAWTTVDSTPSGGTWQEFDFTDVPAVEGYLEVEFRAVDGAGAQIGDAARSHGLRGTGFCVLNSQAQSQLEQNWTTPSEAFSLPLGMRLTTSKVGDNSHVMMHSSLSTTDRGFQFGIGQMAREIHNQYPGYPIHIGTIAKAGSDVIDFIGTGPWQPRWGALGDRYGLHHPGHTLLLMGHSNGVGAESKAAYKANTEALIAEHEAEMGTAGKVVLCPTPRYKGANSTIALRLQNIRSAMYEVYSEGNVTSPGKYVWGGSFSSVVTDGENEAGGKPHPNFGLDGQGRAGSLMAFATMAAHGAMPGPLEMVSATAVADGVEISLSELTPDLEAVSPFATTAPSISGAPIAGETISLTLGTYRGTEPITVTETLTLDGADVTGDIVSGEYTIPLGTPVGQTISLSETASNGVAPNATQSVNTTVVALPNPGSFFGVGDKGFAFDLMDLSGANTLEDETGTVPGVGDPLGYLPGISPNAKTASQATGADRPTVQVDANGRNYLAFDATDMLVTPEDMSNDTWSVWMVYEADGGDFMIMHNPGVNSPRLGIGLQGNANTDLTGSGVVSAQYSYDNTIFSGTTWGQSWTAAQAANLAIIEAVTDATSWTEAAIGDYGGFATINAPGKVYAWGAINRALTPAESDELLNYAAHVRGA